MKVLAVIPARGGSKGIPRKNMRLMAGKPLISYAIENARNSQVITHVAVSSDSDEILAFARQYEGVLALDRSSHLAQDAVTLDPVIYDAAVRAEEELGFSFDVVVTLQPTSPLLTVSTLDAALGQFLSSDADSMISVVNAPHLSWTKNEKGETVPAYKERLNRQQLPPNYLETGAFLAARRGSVTASSRLGSKVTVYEVPEIESTDIDTKQDWVVCEALLSRKTIVFRADGHRELGLGHIFRVLTLAYEFTEHDVLFLCDSRYPAGAEKLRGANMKVVEVDGEQGTLSWLEKNRPDIYVHDCLDTTVDFINAVKKLVPRVVTFEDLGDGARKADAVVNAIYEGASPHSNVFTGKRYVCLRDEFLVSRPSSFSEEVKEVLVMFGGTDPLDLSKRIFQLALRVNGRDSDGGESREGGSIRRHFTFILGPGYAGEEVRDMPELGIEVHRDVTRVTDFMGKADLAFSSQGRTTFELASMGVPTIVLAQNERELLHRFAQMDNGFINLGLGSEVSDSDIEAAFDWIVGASSVRAEMHRLMLANDLKSGIKRVKQIILGEN